MKINKHIISIVEDQVEIGTSLKITINASNDYVCDAHYTNGKDAIDGIVSCSPDLVLLDIGLPDLNGIEVLKVILNKKPSLKVVIFTVFDSDDILFEALRNGACGYILKDANYEIVLDAISDALNHGGPMSPEIAKKVIKSFHVEKKSEKLEKLTDHQMQILKHVSHGLLNKEIADLLNVSEGTIKVQITTIYKKLQVNNRVEASALFFKDRS
ncbi:MAG: hypothetical protein RLZZ546_2946 [Bacteroidota bacterium]|jgi:DNA-binding NarL/FixJ family response regulator